MNSNVSRTSYLLRHPWMLVVLAFILLITAWSSLIVIAMKHAPETIETTTVTYKR